MAVSTNQIIRRQAGCRGAYPVEESVNLYEGTLAFLNAAGFAVPTTGTGQHRFAGVVIAQQDNTQGADGAATVEVWREGLFDLVGTGFSQASVGQDAYATDNYAITAAPSASGVRIGRIEEYVSATVVRVAIDPESSRPVAATVATKTADFDIEAADSGKTYSSTGATGTITGVLPPAAPGLKYRFRVGAAQQFRIDPDGTDTISLPSTGVPGAAGKYLVADAAGETVDLECVVAGTWSVFGFTGTWTAEA